MKKFIFVCLMISIQASIASVIDGYNVIGEENEEIQVPASSWYWDPNFSGIGFGSTIQKSKHGESGWFGFGAFYAYKEDGTQVWYTVQGDYIPNPNPNAWKENKSAFGFSGSNVQIEGNQGNYWGSDDSWMGRISSNLYETSNGMPLGEPWRENDIFVAGEVEIIWRSPEVIEIYLDGSETPTHVMHRMRYYADILRGDAGFLTENHYKMIGMIHGLDVDQGVYMDYINTTTSFREIDPISFFGSGYDASDFYDLTELTPSKQYFLSTRPIGMVRGEYATSGNQAFDQVTPMFHDSENGTRWVLMVYDKESTTLSGYIMRTVPNGIPENGLSIDMGDYKFKGYLYTEDEGKLSLYPAACSRCNGATDSSFKPELTRRSVWHLFKIPDSTGKFLENLPDVHEEDFNY